MTDVRGRTIGHGHLCVLEDRVRFIGAPGQSATFAAHVDKYTIREDARPEILENGPRGLCRPIDETLNTATDDALSTADDDALGVVRPFPQPGYELVVMPADPTVITAAGTAFHDLRIRGGYPWYGIDFNDQNLPQELDRDPLAISFTKGCYLGQETVARLDALGQVQKKLVRLAIRRDAATNADPLMPSTRIVVDGKPIARLTSITTDQGHALAMVRRSHFDAGTEIRGQVESSGASFTAVVEAASDAV